MNTNKVFNFVGSKWFIFILALVMTAILPITYKNLMIVYNAQMMGRLWWIPTVFVVNLVTVMMCWYKFVSLVTKKKESQEWE